MFNTFVKFYSGSTLIAVSALAAMWYFYGLSGLYVATLLTLLEVSLSFDNAVVNAKELETWDKFWKTLFIWVGLPIAVFGMRFLFPMAVVATTTDIPFFSVYHVAMNDPTVYHEAMEHAKAIVYAFGGSFLMMVSLSWFFGDEIEVHWLKPIEGSRLRLALVEVPMVEMIFALAIWFVLLYFMPSLSVAIAYMAGVMLFMTIRSISETMKAHKAAGGGLAGLLYLEVLDASFSFDGVIGAFAMSNDIIVIAVGLGIGAFFVRSMTIHFVEAHTLKKFVFLEHGAHYAIAILAGIMFVKMFVEVPEIITGTASMLLIGAAFVSSIMHKRGNAGQEIEVAV